LNSSDLILKVYGCFKELFPLQQATMVPVLARAMEDDFIANRKFTSCYNINILYVGLVYGV
jgi:hypothetical protein